MKRPHAVKSPDPEPRDYQLQALENLKTLRRKGVGRALVVLASGLGKTFIAAFDAQQFTLNTRRRVRILYLSHQYVILEQARKTFQSVFTGKDVRLGRFDSDQKDLDAEITFAMFQSVNNNLTLFDR